MYKIDKKRLIARGKKEKNSLTAGNHKDCYNDSFRANDEHSTVPNGSVLGPVPPPQLEAISYMPESIRKRYKGWGSPR